MKTAIIAFAFVILTVSGALLATSAVRSLRAVQVATDQSLVEALR